MENLQLWKSNIFVVNGAPGAGKDTFCNFVKEQMAPGYCMTISTVDKVKEIAKECGWDGEKDPKSRKFLSDLKDLLTEWGEVPIKDVIWKINNYEFYFNQLYLDSSTACIFVMAREPSDIYTLTHLLPNCRSLIVRNKKAEAQPTSNHADEEVLDYEYDVEINNNGTLEELQNCAETFIKDFCLERNNYVY